jgi:uncharacterized protein YodC (DUF2158 family)
MEDLQMGDVVWLKGGTQRMTLIIKSDDPQMGSQYICAWHDSKGNEKRANYPPEALTKTEPQSTPPAATT